MGNKNGKGKGKNKVNKHDKAVLDLKVQRDKLQQYQDGIEKLIEREHQIAKELLKKGQKNRAILALKKKKYQEKQLDDAIAMMDNIQKMVDSIEFAQMEQEVFEGLKEGNEALAAIHKTMTVEDVENLMLDTQEAIDTQNEIEAMLGDFSLADEEELLEELQELVGDEIDVAAMPDVPDADPQATATQAKAKATPKKTAVAAT